MWQVFMMVPVVNDGSPVQEGFRKGHTLRARGMVRIDEMYLDQKEHKDDAIRECLRLAHQTLLDKGYNTTVIGFGIRHRLSKKRAPLEWECSIQEVHQRIDRIYAERGREFKVAG